MGRFQCEECGCVENTATSGYSVRNRPNCTIESELGKLLCSACAHPFYPNGSKKLFTGGWHNRFGRYYLPKGEWKMDSVGTLRHKVTGETDWGPHVLNPEDMRKPRSLLD